MTTQLVIRPDFVSFSDGTSLSFDTRDPDSLRLYNLKSRDLIAIDDAHLSVLLPIRTTITLRAHLTRWTGYPDSKLNKYAQIPLEPGMTVRDLCDSIFHIYATPITDTHAKEIIDGKWDEDDMFGYVLSAKDALNKKEPVCYADLVGGYSAYEGLKKGKSFYTLTCGT